MLAFYTVLLEKDGFPVKYIDPETCRIKRYVGPFNDPGEASQDFQAGMARPCCYLEHKQFTHKARAIARLRRNKNEQRRRELRNLLKERRISARWVLAILTSRRKAR